MGRFVNTPITEQPRRFDWFSTTKTVVVLLVVVCSLGLATPSIASARILPPDADLEAVAVDEEEVEEGFSTTCNVQGIGWVVCPVVQFIGDLNDLAFGLLSRYFLEIDSSLVQDKATRDAWTTFRDIANVLFVIAFVVIVYAQMLGGRK